MKTERRQISREEREAEAQRRFEMKFLLPLTIPAVPLKYSAVIVCAAATFAAIQEGHLIRTGRE